jgi:hypothetical protein
VPNRRAGVVQTDCYVARIRYVARTEARQAAPFHPIVRLLTLTGQ